MANQYLNYYQGKLWKAKPGKAIDMYKAGLYVPSDKQLAYLNSLVSFMRSKGMNTRNFDRPRSKRECSSNIRTAIAILKREGLDMEFFSTSEDGAKITEGLDDDWHT